MSDNVTPTFDTDDFTAELTEAPANLAVGKTMLFENESVRVWASTLEPGTRVPFHNHTIDYFWICVRASSAYQRFVDGTACYIEPTPGQVSFQRYGPGENLIHDLENVGDGPLEIVTVELLDTGAPTHSHSAHHQD
jgi:oxalate decarboxylase/phosphoglucose isomerase-like protein (cupin superfamily)